MYLLIKKKNKHIIEIGGGAVPHIDYMNKRQIKTYTIVDSLFFKSKILSLNNKYKKIKFYFINYKDLKSISKRKKFTRLIASHSFEHFQFFEKDFLKILKFLHKDAILSVALPCDPGLTWRFLQYFSYLNQKKVYSWENMREKDLDDTRDHLTSVQNILKVINFYFKNVKKIFFPLILPIIEFNIFLILQIKLSNFRKVN